MLPLLALLILALFIGPAALAQDAARALFSRSFAAGDKPHSVVAADLDGDTIPDLVTVNLSSDDVSVLLGNGNGTFQTAVSFGVSLAEHDLTEFVAVADLDGDNAPDLVTANRNSSDVSVLINLPEPSRLLLAGAALATLWWLRGRD